MTASVIAWALKWLWQIIVAVLIAGIAIYAGYRIFGDGPKQAEAIANATTAVSAAGTASAHDAVQTVAGNAAHEATVHDTVEIIMNLVDEPGASVLCQPELDAAGRAAICVLDRSHLSS